MSIKQGDLVSVDPRCVNESYLIPDKLLAIDNIAHIFLSVVKGPYENLITYQLENKKLTNIFIAVDAVYMNQIIEGIPVKFLRRIT